jgi:hypothetical protein
MSSRRIPDPGSLIAGITFAGVGLIFLVGKVDLADRARWVWPIVLVGLGAGLIAAVLRRSEPAAADGPDSGAAAAADGPDSGPAARSTLQQTATSTIPPSGASGASGAAAGMPFEPPADHVPAPRDQAGPPAREAALDDGAEVEAGAEPAPAQDGATEDDTDEASRAEDRAGGDLPPRHEP